MRIQWAPGSNFFWLFFSNTAETYPISIFQLCWSNGCLFVLSQKLRCLHKDWTTLLEELCYQHCSSNYVVNLNLKGSLQIKFSEKFGILSQLRGGGVCQSQLFKPKPQPYKRVILLGFCCNMAGVPQSQPKNHQTQKIWDFSMKK